MIRAAFLAVLCVSFTAAFQHIPLGIHHKQKIPAGFSALDHRRFACKTAAPVVRHRKPGIVELRARGPGVDTKAPQEQGIASYYEVLGVSMASPQPDVKRAYTELAKQYHPDVTGGDPASTQFFYLIRDAYEILGDVDARKRYNTELLSSGYRPKGSVRSNRGQDLGMTKLEFFIVVAVVNIPGTIFLWFPLLGVKIEDLYKILGF